MSNGLTKAREQALIAAAAGGDRDASGALISAHQASVYAYIVRLCGKPDLAEDVVQEAFVRVLTNLDRFDVRFRFSTWLFTIARRVMLNILEKRKPVSDSDRMGELSARAGGSRLEAEEVETRVVYRDVVQRALMALTLDQREVIVLFHQHEWPIWLIAEQMSMPEGTVKSHLHRGRVKLREALEREPQVPGSRAALAREAWAT